MNLEILHQAIAGRSGRLATIRIALFAAAWLLLVSCAGPSEPRGTVDLAAFKKMARASDCADTYNLLYLIDGRLVFWDKAGACADASYGQVLFGSTPDQILCSLHDSIAGPVKECQDTQYQELFDTITANSDAPDLGLGPEHTVDKVRF